MDSSLIWVRPNRVALRHDTRLDLADPRVLQLASYALDPPVVITSVASSGAGTVEISHEAAVLGASYKLLVGPLASVSGPDLPAFELPLGGTGQSWEVAAAPLDKDALSLVMSPAGMEALVVPGVLRAYPVGGYPVQPVFRSAAVQPDQSILVRADGWTELPYDLVVGASSYREIQDAAVSGNTAPSGSSLVFGAGARAVLPGPFAGPVVMGASALAAGPAGIVVSLAAGGRRVDVGASAQQDGSWVVSTGSAPVPVPALDLRIVVVPAGRYAVFASGSLIAWGYTANLPVDVDGATLSCAGPGSVVAETWVADGIIQDPSGNPLLARALFVQPPANVLVQRSLRTRKRPLTASLGPHVPAAPEDVILTVSGARVGISNLDPYQGIITPAVPIPRGARDVKAEYETTPNLIFPMLSGEPGLWADEVTAPLGPDMQGAPFSVVLASAPRPKPPRIAHRYLAARRTSSSVLNDPVGLRLSRDKGVGQPPPLVRARPPLSFRADSAEVVLAPPWTISGSGSVGPGPSGSGIATSPEGPALLAVQDADLRDIARAYVTARLDAGPVSPSPLRLGPVLGLHDESRMYLVAVLDSFGSRYVGVLTGAADPSVLDSWSVWPRSPVRALSRSVVAADPSVLPRLLAAGDRARIPEGPQAGQYTVTSLRAGWPSGLTELGLTPELPADPALFGNRDAVMWFDLGGGTQVVRVDADLPAGRCSISAVGSRAVLAADPAAMPAPSDLLQIRDLGASPGRFFFGHLGGTEPAQWGAVFGAALPVDNPMRIAGRTIPGPTVLPDADWAPLGLVSADVSGVVATGSLGPSGILRPDRALGPDSLISTFLGMTALFGASTQDIQVEVSDGFHRIVLGSLCYDEVAGRIPYRQLVPPAILMLDALNLPGAGWQRSGPGSWEAGGLVSVPPRQVAQWSASLPDCGGRVIELDVEPPSSAGATLTIRIEAGSDTGVSVDLEISAGMLRVLTSAGTVVGSRPLPALARITGSLVTAGGLTLLLAGDVIPLTVVPHLLAEKVSGRVGITLSNTARRGAGTARIRRLAVVRSMPPASVRTLGLLRDASAPGDLDSWELPREDATSAPSSAEVGPVIREMDTRATCAVRIVLDPAWGAIMLRPDLPPPPYYDPARSRFAGDMSEPSAGWVNISYDDLPLAPGGASYAWVAAGPGARARFTDLAISVRARSAPGEVGYMPPSEVGRYDSADSGDAAQSPRAAEVLADRTSPRTATLAGTGQWMRQLLEVVDGTRRISAPEVRLGEDGQSIYLDAGADFTSDQLLVRGLPAFPVSEAYLRGLPVTGSPNEVGEGTPPIFPKYFSLPEPVLFPDTGSTGRALEFPAPPPSRPLLPRVMFHVEDEGTRGLITFPSDDPNAQGNGPSGGIPPGPPGPPPDGGGPVIEIGGGLFWERFPLFDDGTSRGVVLLNGPFKPAGGRYRGTPTMDVPPYMPAAVLLPARGRFGRGNPSIVVTGPDGSPIPLPTDTLAMAGPGTVTIDLDEGGVLTHWRMTE